MDIKELQDYRLSDAVKFHNHLNPKIWGSDEHLLPEVREKLMAIAEDFKEFLGLDLEVKDITISGSNAAYTYSDHSDVDLHLVVDLPKADVSEVYRELFDAKKYQYNDQHNFKIGGYDVELYVQNANEPPNSQGIYSVLNNEWIKVPARRKAGVNDESVKSKYEDIGKRIDAAIESGDPARLDAISKKVKEMRQAGLDTTGEFGPENLAFKVLRSNGTLERLRAARLAAKDQQLSIAEQDKPKKKFKYGFGSSEYWQPGFDYYSHGSNDLEIKENTDSIDQQLQNFVNFCTEKLKLDRVPRIRIKRDPAWSERVGSFGRYDPDSSTLIVSIANRHPLDAMRTMAHELTHRKQDEIQSMPMHAGDTGSDWENEANAKAGILMRDFAQLHPEYFAKEPISEASGYIPVNDKEARDPRYSMALTNDIRPGENQRQAKKMGWKTNPAGTPPTAKTNGLIESLTRKLQAVKEGLGFPLLSEEDLDEVAMSPGALKDWVKSAGGMKSGFEAELIFSGLGDEGYSDPEWEPDYDMDERARSIDDIINFFQGGDFADLSDRAADRIRSEMQEEYMNWLYEKMGDDWANDQDAEIAQYLADEEGLERGSEEFEERLAAALSDHTRDYEYAQEAYETDWIDNNELDEEDWLRSSGIRYMTDAENTYGLVWPYMRDANEGGGGDGEFNEANAQRLADDLSETLGVETTVSGGYHSARRDASTWIFEPDGSLEPSEPGDMPVEIVSPPMPLEKTLEIMPKFFEWAESNGAYANKSTGFHMSVSMPEHAGENLDYVKLALFLGDKYVLDQFGRAGNTYCTSAIDKIKGSKSKVDPDSALTSADKVLSSMRNHLNQIASKALAQPSGFGKYVTINPKNNYVEFRSAGGSDYFRDMDKIQNTMMRYARALSIAMDPAAEKQEYAKKLYKLLTDTTTQQVVDPKTGTKRVQAKTPVDKDAISIFSRFVAGEIPKAALKSFIEMIQRGRELERKKTAGEVPKDYDPQGDYVIRKKSLTGDPVGPILHRFNAGGPNAAMSKTDKWAAERGLPRNSIHLAHVQNVQPQSILDTPPEFIPPRPELQQQQQQQPASNPATSGEFVIRRQGPDGEVLYRFNADTDVPGVARVWLQAHGIPASEIRLQHANMVPVELLRAYALQQQQPQQQSGMLSQTDVENRLGWGSQIADANYEIIDLRNQSTPVFKLIANTEADADNKLEQWLSVTGADPSRFAVRRIPRQSAGAPLPGSAIDLQQQRATQAQQQPTSIQSGQATSANGVPMWEIYSRRNGHVFHTFADHTQNLAWQTAQQWLRDQEIEDPSLFSLRPKAA